MPSLPATIQERFPLPGAPRSTEEAASAITAGEIWAMLRRRMVLVIALTVLFGGLAVGGFSVWYFYYPGYTSESLIECVSDIPQAEITVGGERPREEEHERFVLTQAQFIKTPNILGEALRLNKVRETGWYENTPEGEHLLRLTEELFAGPQRGTNFMRVSMECADEEDAQTIVDSVVSQWHEVVLRSTAESATSKPLEAAREEKSNVEIRIQNKRDSLRRLQQRMHPGFAQSPASNVLVDKVRQLSEQVSRHKLELSLLQAYQEIYQDPSGVAVTPEDKALVEQDPEILQLRQYVFQIEQQLDADAKEFGPNHVVIQRLQHQLSAANEKLADARTEKIREVRADRLESVNSAVEATNQALFTAMDQLAVAESQLQDQDRLYLEYTALQDELDRENRTLVDLENKIADLERLLRQQSAIRVNIAQPATEPLQRSSPTILVLLFGLFLAPTLAVGIALMLELLDKSVRTAQDVTRHLEIAMLGAIPDTDDEEVAIERVETAVLEAPRSLMAEAFRQIRTNLQFSAPADRQRLLLITSPRPEDGKTTVACNLALSLSQGGRRVLLVDANFRRPALQSVFNKPRGPGLSNLLIGDGNLASYVVKTDLTGLDLLGSGPVPPNPAELLGGEPARRFLQEVGTKYDQVIIDAPPVLLASDALVLSTAVDGVILVVRANRNSRGVARRACRLLMDVGAHLFGAVLNAAQVTRGGYYREQLRSFYEYQADVESSGRPQSLMPPNE